MKLRLTGIAFFLFCAGLSCANVDEDEDSSEYGVVEGDVGTNCTCGIANKEDQRIVGGEETKKNEYPMIAELSMDGGHMCGGTIITKRHVVTAGHCIFYSYSKNLLPKDEVDVYVGIHEVRGVRAFGGGQHFGIEEFIPHPDYDSLRDDYDIAVIFLDGEIDFNSHNAAPACLPIGNENIIGEELKVIGWGQAEDDADEGTKVLMKVNIEVVTHDECTRLFDDYNVQTNICMYTEGKSACVGDSGGPNLWRDPETNRYVLMATISYGMHCGELPVVNTNVTYVLPWIQSVVSATDPNQKTCAKLTT